MTALPLPPATKAILSFDFDGTLHHPGATPPVPTKFFKLIHKLRVEQGAVWGINTGRSIEHLVEGFIESDFPFIPDWVVAREREIYFPNHLGLWLPHKSWNLRCEAEIHQLFKHAKKLLEYVRHEIEEHTGAQWLEMEGEPAGLISRTEEEMEWIISHISPILAVEPNLSWQRNSIYLRFGHQNFQKGSSLYEISNYYGLPAARCFAVGDSYNDMEMLDPSCAGMTACPANAVSAIRHKVLTNGGIVTKSNYGDGSIEALNHYFSTDL